MCGVGRVEWSIPTLLACLFYRPRSCVTLLLCRKDPSAALPKWTPHDYLLSFNSASLISLLFSRVIEGHLSSVPVSVEKRFCAKSSQLQPLWEPKESEESATAFEASLFRQRHQKMVSFVIVHPVQCGSVANAFVHPMKELCSHK